MKKHFLFLLIMSVSILSLAQDKNDSPYITKSFANELIKNVEVNEAFYSKKV